MVTGQLRSICIEYIRIHYIIITAHDITSIQLAEDKKSITTSDAQSELHEIT